VLGFYKHTNLKGMVSRYKTPTKDKLTNLKGMVSRYKNPTMDKYTNLKGLVSRYKNPTMNKYTNLNVCPLWGFLYLDTIPFKLVSLSIVLGFYIWIPFLLS
jgi:hypothetical protein